MSSSRRGPSVATRHCVAVLLVAMLAGDRVAAVALAPSLPKLAAMVVKVALAARRTSVDYSALIDSESDSADYEALLDNDADVGQQTLATEPGHQPLVVKPMPWDTGDMCTLAVDGAVQTPSLLSSLSWSMATTYCECVEKHDLGSDGYLKKIRVRCNIHKNTWVADTFFSLPIACKNMLGQPSRAKCLMDEASNYWNIACLSIQGFANGMARIKDRWTRFLDSGATGAGSKAAVVAAVSEGHEFVGSAELVSYLSPFAVIVTIASTIVNLIKTALSLFCGGGRCAGVAAAMLAMFGLFGIALFFVPPLAGIIAVAIGFTGPAFVLGLINVLVATLVRYSAPHFCSDTPKASDVKAAFRDKDALMEAVSMIRSMQHTSDDQHYALDEDAVVKVSELMNARGDDMIKRAMTIKETDDRKAQVLDFDTAVNTEGLEQEFAHTVTVGTQVIRDSMFREHGGSTKQSGNCTKQGNFISELKSIAVETAETAKDKEGSDEADNGVRKLQQWCPEDDPLLGG